MTIEGPVALVTGADRGMGRHDAQTLQARAAAKLSADPNAR
jgi:NAD(P)-dependent dehydrogenase (short-subunit alcohol dehydrogenase family)